MSGATMDAADWDARYSGADLVWSVGPNVWVRELCTPMTPGRALDRAGFAMIAAELRESARAGAVSEEDLDHLERVFLSLA